jgi:hypothetical protein
VELGFLSVGNHLISLGAGLINHQTFKNIPNLFHVTICSRAFWIRGFEGGIVVLKRGAPLNSTGARLLYHKTSEISINLLWTKISLWLFQVPGFEGGVGLYEGFFFVLSQVWH